MVWLGRGTFWLRPATIILSSLSTSRPNKGGISFCSALLLCFLCSAAWGQSGWVKSKGEAYLQVGYQGFQSNQYYTLQGNLLTTNTFRQHSLYFYGEYGLTDRWDVLLSMPMYRFNSFESTTWAHGIGDLRVELKYGVLTGQVPVSISVAAEVPTAKGDNFATNRELVFEQINLPTGDGEWNVWLTAAGSHALAELPIYLQGYAAYNLRTGYADSQFRDQLKYGVEVGYQPGKKWWLMARAMAFTTLGEAQNQFTDFIRGEGTQFMAAGLAVNYTFVEHWALVAQGQTYFDGWHPRRNLYSAPMLSVGLARTW